MTAEQRKLILERAASIELIAGPADAMAYLIASEADVAGHEGFYIGRPVTFNAPHWRGGDAPRLFYGTVRHASWGNSWDLTPVYRIQARIDWVGYLREDWGPKIRETIWALRASVELPSPDDPLRKGDVLEWCWPAQERHPAVAGNQRWPNREGTLPLAELVSREPPRVPPRKLRRVHR